MVRVNLISPAKLSDQHLIAEYNEILMLVSYIKNKPEIEDIPKKYKLGKGHMKFFKNKVLYLYERHEILKKEMVSRNIKTNKSIDLKIIREENKNNWTPGEEDFKIIRERIKEKIMKKPDYYRYKKEKKDANFFIELLNN